MFGFIYLAYIGKSDFFGPVTEECVSCIVG